MVGTEGEKPNDSQIENEQQKEQQGQKGRYGFEGRDICELNLAGGPPLDALAEEDCWLIGPFELELGQMEDAKLGEGTPRVALRSLFADSGRAEK